MIRIRVASWAAAGAALASFSLAGCGVGTERPVSSVQLVSMSGQVHGGANPVIGATVTLYETQVGDGTSAGSPPLSTYGTAGKVLATTTSDGGGSFNFAPSTYTCDTAPFMQYAYLVVSGGNTGGNTANASSVLMAALGPCTNLSVAQRDNVRILVSEATTIAAAYALGQFMTVSGTTGSSLPMAIGAPSTNDAPAPACTGSGATLSCSSNGLGHAFSTAMALVNGVSIGGGLPSGQFNTSMPGYAGSVIPQTMLNVVANALQACVNTSGGTSNGCSSLFTDTTVNGVAPTDTLAAAINLARNPTLSAAVGSGGIFSIASATSFFQPTLAAAPADYSLGIFYPGSTPFGGNAFAPNPYFVALDTADNVYVLAADGNAPGTNTTRSGLASLTYGTNGPSAAYGYFANSGSPLSSGLVSPGTLAVDSASNVYETNFTSAASTSIIRQFAGASGLVTTAITPSAGGSPVPYQRSLAIDKSNNLFMATTTGSGTTAPAASSGIYQVPVSGIITSQGAFASANQNGLIGIAIDANQNVFSCGIGIAGGSVRVAGFVPSSSTFVATTAAPTASTAGAPYTTGTVRLQGFINASAFMDANGSFYCPVQHAIAQVSPTFAAPTLTVPAGFEQIYPAATATSASVGTLPTAAAGGEADGTGNFFIAANEQAGMLYMLKYLAKTTTAATPFVGGTDNPLRMDPCYPQLSAGATYCSSNAEFGAAATNLLGYATGFQIDSTGSIWVAVGSNAANTTNSPTGVVQIIGPASPTVPQLSAARPGVRP